MHAAYPDLPAEPPADRPGRRTWRSPPNCYFAYPHMNGFLPGADRLVLTRIDDEHSITFLEWRFPSGDVRPIHRTNRGDLYCDVAAETGELFFVHDRNALVAVSAEPGSEPQVLLRPQVEQGAKLEGLLSVTPDGARLLYAVEVFDGSGTGIKAAKLFELDRRGGAARELCDLSFNADHQHYCPFDPGWIGFAHEGDIRESLDRVWGLNQAVNNGRPMRLWDEHAPDRGSLLAGHERWAFHRAGAFVVAFPSSPGDPKGLYFVDAPTRTASLVSASNYDWHCNISRSGRWAVVDTKPPRGRAAEADGRQVSDIVLVEVASGRRHWLARSHAAKQHPWHPHPHITPDERFVVFNDYEADGAGTPSRTVVVEIAP